MNEQPGLSEQYRTASPWPLFVALGFALSEIGVFLGLFPIAVGGLLLLGGSVAGVLRESGYVAGPWRPLAGLGIVFAALGAAVVWVGLSSGSLPLADLVAEPDGVAGRGLAIAAAGVILVAAAGTGRVMSPSTA